MIVWGGLTNSWEKKRSESQRRKGKISECRVSEKSKNTNESLLKWITQRNRGKQFPFKTERERLESSSKKLDAKGTVYAKIGRIKGKNGKDSEEAEEIKRRWQEYPEELYKKGLNDLDNDHGMVTHLEPDILQYEVKLALGRIIVNKGSRTDEIPAELSQILKSDAGRMLYSISQQIWQTQQWPQDWKRYFHSNTKECANHHTIVLISHSSKVMLKIFQTRLQQYVYWELSYVQGGFRKGRETRGQIANIHWVTEKAIEFQKKKPIYFCFIDQTK